MVCALPLSTIPKACSGAEQDLAQNKIWTYPLSTSTFRFRLGSKIWTRARLGPHLTMRVSSNGCCSLRQFFTKVRSKSCSTQHRQDLGQSGMQDLCQSRDFAITASFHKAQSHEGQILSLQDLGQSRDFVDTGKLHERSSLCGLF